MDSGDQNSALIQLLQQVRLLDPASDTEQVADVLIEDNQIREVAPEMTDYPSSTQVREADGLILAPGLVDLYSHSGEPGNEDRETLASLAKAALAGGFAQVGILPDTQPTLDRPGHLQWLQRETPPDAPNFALWGSLTLGGEGTQMTELTELAEAGIVGFSDTVSLCHLGLLRRGLEYVQPLGTPVALSVRDRALSDDGVMREGELSMQTGLPGDPAVSETSAIAAVLELVAATETPVHLMRISTARSVELIAAAKARGFPITASTTWMHLLLNTAAVTSYDPNLNLCPPLGDRADQMALIDGVKAGVIDAIAVDHTPYTYEEKTVAFAEAPPGAIGLELALPLLWQNFVETKEWTALELWQALSVAPRACLKQPPWRCAVGEPTNAILFDPKKTWTVNKSNLKSLSTNTPWLGKQLTGQVVATFLNDAK
ncbi:dihydroorotase [Halothece sp. PCC 7418]|uniref:dihydroorotase n=1 Tax=Halothece sp. (strain PCC 7418) TaxID=65093 RepID=UPI0002A08828|nr:dihydroorotase [Halothece sp. PCC 7418]AFZ42781.1 dihydroorotase [Halothece sp. PCC 7418]